MRFMLLMIPKVYNGGEQPPEMDPKMIATMETYNNKMKDAGILLAAEGLHPQSEAVRVSYRGGKGAATDGPFTEAKEVLGGYWVINVASKADAVKWAVGVPATDGDIVEVREVQEMEDFPEAVQKELAKVKAAGNR